jgi:hypothetical protein
VSKVLKKETKRRFLTIPYIQDFNDILTGAEDRPSESETRVVVDEGQTVAPGPDTVSSSTPHKTTINNFNINLNQGYKEALSQLLAKHHAEVSATSH